MTSSSTHQCRNVQKRAASQEANDQPRGAPFDPLHRHQHYPDYLCPFASLPRHQKGNSSFGEVGQPAPSRGAEVGTERCQGGSAPRAASERRGVRLATGPGHCDSRLGCGGEAGSLIVLARTCLRGNWVWEVTRRQEKTGGRVGVG